MMNFSNSICVYITIPPFYGKPQQLKYEKLFLPGPPVGPDGPTLPLGPITPLGPAGPKLPVGPESPIGPKIQYEIQLKIQKIFCQYY